MGCVHFESVEKAVERSGIEASEIIVHDPVNGETHAWPIELACGVDAPASQRYLGDTNKRTTEQSTTTDVPKCVLVKLTIAAVLPSGHLCQDKKYCGCEFTIVCSTPDSPCLVGVDCTTMADSYVVQEQGPPDGLADYSIVTLASSDHACLVTDSNNIITALFDVGCTKALEQRVVKPGNSLSVPTYKQCDTICLNYVEVYGTTGDADGCDRAATDDTADIVGITREVACISNELGVKLAMSAVIYGPSLGLVAEWSLCRGVYETAPTDIALTFEEKCSLNTIASLRVFSSVVGTCLAPEEGLAVTSSEGSFEDTCLCNTHVRPSHPDTYKAAIRP